MGSELTDRLLAKVATDGILRARDAEHAGIARTYLRKAVENGSIERIGRGLYAMPGVVLGEHQTLFEASKRVPNGVICLLSALQAHGLTTQNPHEVWLCIDTKARKPSVDYPKLRVVRCSKDLLHKGVEKVRVGTHSIPIFCAARTVADCFRYRNKIGVDVAVEALRDCVRKRIAKLDEIWKYAKLCRVNNVMRPYLEMMVE